MTRIPNSKVTHGEVPHWDEEKRSLFYININGPNSTFARYDYDEQCVYQATIDNVPSLLFILPVEGTTNQFIVGIERKAVIVHWDGRSPKATVLRTLFEVDRHSSANYFNDVKTDPFGRFYGGTKCVESCDTNDRPTSGFYRYETGKGLRKLFGDVFISNGLTWSPQGSKFYYVDSCTYDVKEFDYNPKNGDICKFTQAQCRKETEKCHVALANYKKNEILLFLLLSEHMEGVNRRSVRYFRVENLMNK